MSQTVMTHHTLHQILMMMIMTTMILMMIMVMTMTIMIMLGIKARTIAHTLIQTQAWVRVQKQMQ
jgi:hypothetical protein